MGKIKKLCKKHLFSAVLVLPMTIYILGFTVWPILQTIGMGFQDKFTGAFTLENYAYLFGRPSFVTSIFNTAAFASSLWWRCALHWCSSSSSKAKAFCVLLC